MLVLASLLLGQVPAQANTGPRVVQADPVVGGPAGAAPTHPAPAAQAPDGSAAGQANAAAPANAKPAGDPAGEPSAQPHGRVRRGTVSERLTWTVTDGNGIEVGGAVFELEGPRDASWRHDSVDEVWNARQDQRFLVSDAVAGNTGTIDDDPDEGLFAVTGQSIGVAGVDQVFVGQRYRLRPVEAPLGWEFVDRSWALLPSERPNSPRAQAGTWLHDEASFGEFIVRRLPDTQLSWRATDTSGRLVGGATATLQGPSAGAGTIWNASAEVPDCVSAPCNGLDTDPVPGAFRVTSATAVAKGVLGGLRANGNFRVRISMSPGGHDLQSAAWATMPSVGDQGVWNNVPQARSHDFWTLTAAAAQAPAPIGSATISVRIGGDRIRDGVTAGLAGVALVLNTGETSPSGSRPDGVPGDRAGWARCVSDATGICQFTVPGTQWGGPNRDARYWVTQTAAPEGWFANPVLRTGTPATPATTSEYRFRTGQELRAGTTYSSTVDFMVDQREAVTASTGVWPQSRNNPAPPPGCSANVALILDYSGSASSQPAQLRAATDSIVDGLVGTKTKLSLFSFSNATPALRATQNFPTLTEVETPEQAAQFKSRYTSWTAEGGTNWDRGLAAPAEADQPGNHFDLALVISDGNPTFFGSAVRGSGRLTRFSELENAVFSANQLKANGTRVMALGVGPGAAGAENALNLRAITGPVAGKDYLQVPDYASAAAQVQQVLGGSCAAPITVTNMIVPLWTPPGETTGATPAGAGWTFTAREPGPGLSLPVPASRTTSNDGTGSVEFPFTLPAENVRSAPVTIATAVLPGYTLVPVRGKPVVCRDSVTGAEVPAAAAGANAFRVSASKDARVGCTVYYHVPDITGTLAVTKTWVLQDIDGKTIGTYRLPGQSDAVPAGLSASLRINGPGSLGESEQPWGVPRSGFTEGNTAKIVEAAGIDARLLPGCSMVSQRATKLNATVIDQALPYVAPISRGPNTVELTNTVTCEQTLELRSSVDNGPASPSAWTLTASAPGGARQGPTGKYSVQGSVRGSVTAAAAYRLAESGGSDVSAYVQRGPWSCANARTGAAVALSGGAVSVPLGQGVICEVRNATAELTVYTDVADGGLPPSRLAVEGAPVGGSPGLPPVSWAGAPSGPSSPAGGPVVPVRPDQGYSLSERVVGGGTLAYLVTNLQRWDGGAWVDVPRTATGTAEVAVPIGTHAYYRFVNSRAPALALPHTGGTAAELLGALGGIVALIAVALAVRARRTRAASPGAQVESPAVSPETP